MSYQRVLPRDAFNEANYLKCIGRLALIRNDQLEGYQYFELVSDLYEEFGSSFSRNQDGDLYCHSTFIRVLEGKYRIYRNLNSRSPYPVYIITDVGMIDLLTDEGNLTQDFIDWVNA